MDRHRMAWLVAAPLLSAAGALVLGSACAAAAAVVVTPYGTDVEVTVSGAGRELLAAALGELDSPVRLMPVVVGLVIAALAWTVGLGVGAQELFPRRRRLVPAAGAVLLSAAAGWVALGLLAVGTEAREIAVGSAAGAIVLAWVAAGLVVFPLAGRHWPEAPQRLPRTGTAGAARPARLR
ncbi:MAG: hypothetical protein GX609_06630 [Actinomycetales bacterium]|nr:hypothetical protein [Actinomycetales bacterium]